MKHLFIGGPWDGQVHDIEAELGARPGRFSAITVPTGRNTETVIYYPRSYRWATERGGVEIEVMATSVTEPLGGRLLLHLFRLAQLDVTWQPDPNDPG